MLLRWALEEKGGIFLNLTEKVNFCFFPMARLTCKLLWSGNNTAGRKTSVWKLSREEKCAVLCISFHPGMGGGAHFSTPWDWIGLVTWSAECEEQSWAGFKPWTCLSLKRPCALPPVPWSPATNLASLVGHQVDLR